MSRSSTSGQGTKNHKVGCKCPVCDRVSVAALKGEIAILKTSEANLTTNLTLAREDAERADQSARDWERTANERQAKIEELESSRTAQCETLMVRNGEISNLQEQLEALRSERSALCAAIFDAIEKLTSGAECIVSDTPRASNLDTEDVAALLAMAAGYGADAIGQVCIVEELLEIDCDMDGWHQALTKALDGIQESARGPVEVERNQYKRELEALKAERSGLWGRIKELEAKPTLPKRSLPRWLWVVQLVAVAAVALAFGIDAWLSAGGRHR